MANTGRLLYHTLIKVTDDGTNRALDANNMLVTETGNPQDTKPNLPSDPDYVHPKLNLQLCPPDNKEYAFTINAKHPLQKVTATVERPEDDEGVVIEVHFSAHVDGLGTPVKDYVAKSTSGSGEMTITAGTSPMGWDDSAPIVKLSITQVKFGELGCMSEPMASPLDNAMSVCYGYNVYLTTTIS